MDLVLDTHAHTVASGHAYSTVKEYIEEAKKKGLELICITDHGPEMPGGAHPYHFWNLKAIPRVIDDIVVIRGSEVNIIDYDGTIDLDEESIIRLDFVIASMHHICMPQGTIEQNTQAVINAIKNKYVDVIGHPDDQEYDIDPYEMIKAAQENGKAIELNNSSIAIRLSPLERIGKLASIAKDLKVPVACGSDSHICYNIGNFEEIQKVLKNVNMPEELVLNSSVERFYEFLNKRGKTII